MHALCRAYDAALALPAETFAPEPHLKISGIAISLAEALEEGGQPREAYKIYLDALERIQQVHFLPESACHQRQAQWEGQGAIRAA